MIQILVASKNNFLQLIEKYKTDDIEFIFESNNFRLLRIINSKKIDVLIIDLDSLSAKEQLIRFCQKKFIDIIIVAKQFNDTLKQFLFQFNIFGYTISDSNILENTYKILDKLLKRYKTKILLVDDSKVQLSYSKEKLLKHKFQVTTATNGVEALKEIEKEKFDLILTDFNMPKMDGFDLVLNLRKKYSKNELGIIVLSSSDKEEISSAFLKIGANDFINIPYSDLEFITKINSVLELIESFKSLSEKEKELFESKKFSSLGEMIGNIAHQWRQPLSAISSNISSLKLELSLGLLDDSELNKKFDEILQKTVYLSNVINNFININIKNDVEVININELVENVIIPFKQELSEKNIKISIENKDKIDFIYGFKDALSQAFTNVIKNAIESVDGVENKNIFIKVFKYFSKIIVEISDSGIGINEKIIDKVFDPYFTTKHQSQGTGLGLYITKLIIEKYHNGKIGIQNIEEGVKVRIELPI